MYVMKKQQCVKTHSETIDNTPSGYKDAALIIAAMAVNIDECTGKLCDTTILLCTYRYSVVTSFTVEATL